MDLNEVAAGAAHSSSLKGAATSATVRPSASTGDVAVMSGRRDRACSIFSFGGGAHLLEVQPGTTGVQMCSTGAAECMRQAYLADAVEFLSDLHTLSKLKVRPPLTIISQ